MALIIRLLRRLLRMELNYVKADNECRAEKITYYIPGGESSQMDEEDGCKIQKNTHDVPMSDSSLQNHQELQIKKRRKESGDNVNVQSNILLDVVPTASAEEIESALSKAGGDVDAAAQQLSGLDDDDDDSEDLPSSSLANVSEAPETRKSSNLSLQSYQAENLDYNLPKQKFNQDAT
ncbi:uncharacterized protein LOC124448108 [Xenia sp. Carnegie-2017]|uniref:uncharacterized protein LOC124448108 n=1 Tax=Xenia sp. Carnegie-2017 TaxID=2897299 RepID=UPI001F04597E|nr:uncharacterized protein LOC124448108 [Xenia sp. Carnegie-2017]